LLTIVGPGGMGKTRLALALAARQTGRRVPGSDRLLFPDGVWLVSLAPVESTAQLVTAIAEALDLELRPPGERQRSPEKQVSDFLRRKRLLLVLDNFEHLLDAAPLLARLLAEAPDLKVLVTSRQRLQLQGEHVFWIEGLEVPAEDAGSAAVRNTAVRLFVNTARQVEPAFALDEGEVAAVVRICRLLAGSTSP
jgi:predicted ATPase